LQAAPEQPRADEDEKDDYENGGGVVVNLIGQDHVQIGVQDDATMSLHLVTANRQGAHVQGPVKGAARGRRRLADLLPGNRKDDC
jgi:hypothetical protein